MSQRNNIKQNKTKKRRGIALADVHFYGIAACHGNGGRIDHSSASSFQVHRLWICRRILSGFGAGEFKEQIQMQMFSNVV
jgi:hypothetical protein